MFTFILVLMTVSILGIAALECYWVSDAIREKSEAFDLSVRRAMNDVVAELEVDAAENLIQETFHGLDFSNDYKAFVPGAWKTDTSYMSRSGLRNFIIMRDSIMTMDIESGTVDLEIKGEYRIPAFQTHSKKWIKGVDTVSISDAHHKQGVISTAMRRVLVKQIRQEPSIKETVEGKNLDSLLSAHLGSNGILSHFEFGFAISERDSVIKDYSRSNYDRPGSFEYQASLFPGQPSEALILLDFPEKSIYIIRSLGGLMGLVLLFSLLMLTTFGTTVYYIMRQKKLNEVKTDFINNMTHELKTPLATIGLAVDSMRHPANQNNWEVFDKLSEIIVQEKQRLTSHVEQILQMAKMDRGDLQVNRKPIDITELVREAVSNMQFQADTAGGKIEMKFSLERTTVEVDGGHFYNAIVNLIDNALKYCDQVPRVEIVVSAVENDFQIGVSDNGIGMNAKEQRKVFDTFYRVQSGNLHNVKGFGLGLSYVREVVRLHGGKLFIESKPGKGSTVGFTIPFTS